MTFIFKNIDIGQSPYIGKQNDNIMAQQNECQNM